MTPCKIVPADSDGSEGGCTSSTSQTHIDIKNWYTQKLANPWVLPSINKYLSKISDENWDITPNQSNIAETAHTGCNAETSIGVGLLTAILQFVALLICTFALYSNIISDLKCLLPDREAWLTGLLDRCFSRMVIVTPDGVHIFQMDFVSRLRSMGTGNRVLASVQITLNSGWQQVNR
ncbi:hypothetical protein B0H17DRAFT_1263787 [Mycena rosella]|uniref:Uncharacterized protein n=1 Tax=Mycena rosella TaxID=1033263 RepID=A0AAD7MAZ1_MYCRO|nr:hypothetical protein B0H17DRAFT_1263787 [Mycena rosella]